MNKVTQAQLHEIVASIIGRYVTIDYLAAHEGEKTATLTLNLSDFNPTDVATYQYQYSVPGYDVTAGNVPTP